MVLAWICGELWRGQAQNGVNLAFQVKFDLEGQGQSPPKTIGTLTKFFCTFCPNLMVLAWTRDDLWHGQAQGWRTHTQTDTHTDRQTQATTIPEGQNWPRVKNHKSQFSKPKIKRLPGSGIQNMHMKFEINKNSKQNWSYALETMPSANGQADRQGESSVPPTNPHQLYKKAMRKWPWFDV